MRKYLKKKQYNCTFITFRNLNDSSDNFEQSNIHILETEVTIINGIKYYLKILKYKILLYNNKIDINTISS